MRLVSLHTDDGLLAGILHALANVNMQAGRSVSQTLGAGRMETTAWLLAYSQA